jgi:hypothetical protein
VISTFYPDYVDKPARRRTETSWACNCPGVVPEKYKYLWYTVMFKTQANADGSCVHCNHAAVMMEIKDMYKPHRRKRK